MEVLKMEFSRTERKKNKEAAGKHYSDEKFWGKVKEFGIKAGSSVVYTALLLYYTLQKPDVPKKVKAAIIGGLGYFILPIDTIPDVLAGLGFTDDLFVLGAALVQVAMYIDQDVKNRSKEQLKQWFGENADTTAIDAKIE